MEEWYATYAQVFSSLSLCWLSLTAWWLLNTWYWNERHAQPLHKIMSFVLVFKTLHLSFTTGLFVVGLAGPTLPLLILAMSTAYTLYITFVFLTFILIAKGFSLCRSLIDANELKLVGIAMCAVYLGFSVYMADPGGLSLLLLAMLLVLYYTILASTQQSIEVINIQLIWLATSEIPEMMRPVRLKLQMLSSFSVLMRLFFVSQVLINGLVSFGFPLVVEAQSSFYLWADVLEETFELVCLTWIFFMFRAKYRGQYFFLAGFNVRVDPHHRQVPLIQASAASGLNQRNSDLPVVFVPPSPCVVVVGLPLKR
jgi:hypothetical protein